MIAIGLDPGRRGAVVAIDSNCHVVLAEPLPYTGKSLDGTVVMDWLLEALGGIGGESFAVLEHQQPHAKQGAVSAFTAGRGFGMLEQILRDIGIRYAIERPSRTGWHKVLSGIEGQDAKDRAVLLCQRELPGLDLLPGRCRKPHDGLADAGAMALWALKR
jgi:crossover junction endodeoxyribonuclease RuvC